MPTVVAVHSFLLVLRINKSFALVCWRSSLTCMSHDTDWPQSITIHQADPSWSQWKQFLYQIEPAFSSRSQQLHTDLFLVKCWLCFFVAQAPRNQSWSNSGDDLVSQKQNGQFQNQNAFCMKYYCAVCICGQICWRLRKHLAPVESGRVCLQYFWKLQPCKQLHGYGAATSESKCMACIATQC